MLHVRPDVTLRLCLVLPHYLWCHVFSSAATIFCLCCIIDSTHTATTYDVLTASVSWTVCSADTGTDSFRRALKTFLHVYCPDSRPLSEPQGYDDVVCKLTACLLIYVGIITSNKGGGKCFCPCLSVCLSFARLLKNTCMDLDEMLRVDRCRDMDELINFWAWSGL